MKGREQEKIMGTREMGFAEVYLCRNVITRYAVPGDFQNLFDFNGPQWYFVN
jgi:hypothetical protein